MIYFDNAATTPLRPCVIKAMTETFGVFGNPSSVHTFGVEAERLVAAARRQVLSSLAASNPKFARGKWRVIFTGSGTEANNLAVLGVTRAKNWHLRYNNPIVITTNGEHSSVEEAVKKIDESYKSLRLSTVGGTIGKPDTSAMPSDVSPFLASIMSVGNETGAEYNVEAVSTELRRKYKDIIIHTDATQALGHTKISAAVDMITVSAHKIGGPKGVGALIVREEMLRSGDLRPIIFGGGQEGGLRSGTENVVGIVGFGAAAEDAAKNYSSEVTAMSGLRDYLIAALPPSVTVNRPAVAAPHIVSLKLPNIMSETMVNYLSLKGIAVSAGSACSSKSARKEENPALEAFGLSKKEAKTTLRVSLSAQNTKEEADALITELTCGTEKLARIK